MVECYKEEIFAEPCNIPKCCGKYLFYAEAAEGKKVLIPLTKVDVKVEIQGAFASTKVELSYVNASKDNPYECTYSFPLEKTNVLTDFEANIDDRVIKTKVKDKEDAEAQYDDAVAKGNAAVLAKRSNKQDEVINVSLGNLLPGQAATLSFTVISRLQIVAGYFAFSLPAAFYPDYKKHGVKDSNALQYEFGYQMRILSATAVSNLSIPEHAIVTEKNANRTDLTVKSGEAGRCVDLYYRTADMMVPQMQYAKIEDSDVLAVSVSLVPTFDPVYPQDFFEVDEDEKPEQLALSNGADFHFVFIVDRSGSMGMNNRMQIAKDALSLFVKSLPSDCSFSVISFGTNLKTIKIEGNEVIEYTDDSKNIALDEINKFAENLGSTDIKRALHYANHDLQSGEKMKRIFILTDGFADNKMGIV